MGLLYTEGLVDKIFNVPVKGSNFYPSCMNANFSQFGKTNWEETPKSSEFNSVNRSKINFDGFDRIIVATVLKLVSKSLNRLTNKAISD